MDGNKKYIIYSEPVREIMGTPPSHLTRWGTAIIFTVFVLFLVLSWLIRYPDLIPSQIEITTENPPATLIAKVPGRIRHLFVNDRDSVERGELLAVIGTPASITQYRKLKIFADTIREIKKIRLDHIPDISGIGELQAHYGTFMKTVSDLENFRVNDYYGNKIKSTGAEITELKRVIRTLNEKEKLQNEILRIEKDKFSRISSLTRDSTIAQIELDQATQDILAKNLATEQIRLDIATENLKLIGKEDLLNEYTSRQREEYNNLLTAADESFRNLKAQIQLWENEYLLIAPLDGVVTFTRFWSENQSVNRDEEVITIIPLSQGDFIGRFNLRMQKSGKVELDQPVNIKLSGYPYLEYGMVRGVVKTKSLVPSGDAYVIEVALPDGLNTLYGKKLEFTQNMQGTAEVITDDVRLLNKILNPFRHLVNINRR
jgi:HlyD family secretion protein